MDVAAGEVVARRRSPVFLVLVLFEPVRSAEPPISSGTAGMITSSTVAGCDLRVAEFGFSADDLRLEARRSARRSRPAGRRPCARSNSARALRRRLRRGASQLARARRAALAGLAPGAGDRLGDARTARASSPASRGRRRSRPRRAASRAPGGAGLGRRAVADDGLAGDQRRLVGASARTAIAASIASWIVAVDLLRRPSRRP